MSQSGSFLFLRGKELVDPEDSDEYINVQYNILYRTMFMTLFSAYWARLYEMGKYKYMIPNRLLFYCAAGGTTAIIHTIYCVYDMNKFLDKMDSKYFIQYKAFRENNLRVQQ
ncbi:hypothetical protein pb186bvf_013868 [Paramecium bursaria]